MLDAASDRYTNHVKISLPEGGVLLVEGLHILKSMYAQYFVYNIYCERVNIGLSALPGFGNSLRFAIEVIPETKSPNLIRAKYNPSE